MDLGLKGKKAIITGGSKGIGLASAHALADEGADVAICSRNIDDVNSASGKFGSEKAPSRNIHPTVKPLTLMNYLVVLGSRKGDIVLEPFAGSGTTALACVSQERDYIAIEREEEYYDIAKARLDKVEQPLKMWEKFS